MLPGELVRIVPYLPQSEIPDEELDKLQPMDTSVPREAGAALINKMLIFQTASDHAYRKYADRIDNAHQVMAAKKEVLYATTQEIAAKVLRISSPKKISPSTLWAIHRACVQDDLGFIPDLRNHRNTGNFEIRPWKEVALVKQVRTWLREYQENGIPRTTSSSEKLKSMPNTESGAMERNPVSCFVKKARRLIQNSRKSREVTKCGGIGPSSVRVKDDFAKVTRSVSLEPFTLQERLIIRFVEFWAAKRLFSTISTMSSLGSFLIRTIGMYEGHELNQATGFVLLQELGVIAPWENRVAFESRLALPGHHEDMLTDQLQVTAAIAYDIRPEESDSMRGLRKDWGSTEIFCVDRIDAMEIDDGFSLEEIEEEPSNYWIHVHIANPTAFMKPEHPAAVYAAHLVETLYLPEKQYHMLSPRLTQPNFSLAKDRPSLTFSAKMRTDGEILDIRIAPGIVRNVSFFSPEAIHEALEPEAIHSIQRFELSVGGTMAKEGRKDICTKPSESQLVVLRKLQELGVARRLIREQAGGVTISLNLNGPEVSAHLQQGGQHLLPWRKHGRIIEGDPIISINTPMFNPEAKLKTSYNAEMLVPDLMILACEIAATWCNQRGIPVIFRGTLSNPEVGSAPDYKRDVLDPALAETGQSPYVAIKNYLSLVGRSVSSPDPIKHDVIGTDAYTKVTSPLRRYGDMLGHWQIEAALRFEAETGKQFQYSATTATTRDSAAATTSTDADVDTDADAVLPFSRAKVAAMLPRIGERERMISAAKRNSQRHWVVQLLFRAHYFKEAPLPDIFRVFVYGLAVGVGGQQGARRAWEVMVRELNINADVHEEGKREGGEGEGEGGRKMERIEVGDWWEARIGNVDLYSRRVLMVLVRLVERGGMVVG